MASPGSAKPTCDTFTLEKIYSVVYTGFNDDESGVKNLGRVKTIGKQIIFINANDHNPPHVHILGGGAKASITLNDLSVIGDIKEAKRAVKWIKDNREQLFTIWSTINP